MASNKKNPAAAASAETAQAAASASTRTKSARSPAPRSAARPATANAAAAKAAATKTAAARKPATARTAKAKPLDPTVQASQEALAKALAAAKAVKITQPLGKPAKAQKEEKMAKADKAPKARKAKLVRDSFTMPEGEYAQIALLKKRLLGKGMVSKKSELLRAGVALLVGLTDGELVAAMQKVEVIKTGRPAKSSK